MLGTIFTTLTLFLQSFHFPLAHSFQSPRTSIQTSKHVSQVFITNQFPTNTVSSPIITALPTPPNNSSGWLYPHATVTSLNGSTIDLQTTDDPSLVTSWYQAQIKAHHFISTSIIRNAVNGTISNVLTGEDAASFYQIEIKQNAGDTITTITVEQDNKK